MLALLTFVKACFQAILDCFTACLNPKVWPMFVVLFALGFMRACSEGEDRMEAHLQLDQTQRDAQRKVDQVIANRNLEAKKEVEDELIQENEDLAAQLADANRRLSDNEQRGFLPSSPGPRSPLPAVGDAGERVFLDRVYSQDILCYQREYLDQGTRVSAGRLRQRLADLAKPAGDAFTDAKGWGNWARKVESCPSDAGVIGGGSLLTFPRPSATP